MDRDLKLAGRVFYEEKGKILSKLFETETAVATIPSIAPHFDRTAGTKPHINLEENFIPILATNDRQVPTEREQSELLLEIIARTAQIDPKAIVDFEASFIDSRPSQAYGVDKSLISSARLSSVGTTYAALKAFLGSEQPTNGFTMFAIFDSHAIGSNNRVGHKSNFIQVTLERMGVPEYTVARSLLVGISGLHAFNASYPALYEGNNKAEIGGGLYYASTSRMAIPTGVTSLLPLQIAAREAGISLSSYVPPIDRYMMPTGDSVLSYKMNIVAAEIGIPVLSIGSVRETMAVSDLNALDLFIPKLSETFLRQQ